MRRLSFAVIAFGTAISGTPARAETGDILLKARATYHHRSEAVTFTLSDPAEVVDASVDDAIGGEASVTLFLTDRLATEFSLGGVTYDLESETGDGVLAAGLLMSTATLQFHPFDARSSVRPYFGAGLSYLNFYGEDPGEVIINGTANSFSAYASGIQGGFSPVAQIGADISLNKRVYMNIDARYLYIKNILFIQSGERQEFSRRMSSLIIASGVGFRF